jgi:hypothetical protein
MPRTIDSPTTGSRPSSPALRPARIIAGAFLLELLLLVTLVPIGLIFGMPGLPGATDFTVFFIAVPVGCFLGGVAAGAWVSRPLPANHALHGLLTGVGATLIYLALCTTQPDSIAGVIAGYGATLFWVSQALRIAGSIAGAVWSARR